ncbi:MAG: integrase [Candidatus Nitrosocosmicus sp.]
MSTNMKQTETRLDYSKKSEWLSVTARIRRNEQDLFNTQLKRLQCETLNELAKDIIAGKIKRITEDEQIDIMKIQAQSSGLLTVQSGYYDFYKKVNSEDFLNWLQENYHIHTANCYYSYYLRYVDTFFGPKPEVELLKLAPHKRSWILQSVKRFGDFYLSKYGTIEVKQLILRIIERYQLNKNLDMKDRIYLVSPQFISEKIDKIISMTGEIGFTCRLGLLSGLREQEIFYIKQKDVCMQAYGCDCENLHVVHCNNNNMTVIAIGWTRGNKKAIATVIPTNYWNKLREIPKFDYADVQAAHKILKREAGIAFIVMRKIHYNVMRFKNSLDLDEAEVLAGRFSSVSARHYVLNDPEKLSNKYVNAWKNFGINVSNNTI